MTFDTKESLLTLLYLFFFPFLFLKGETGLPSLAGGVRLGDASLIGVNEVTELFGIDQNKQKHNWMDDVNARLATFRSEMGEVG